MKALVYSIHNFDKPFLEKSAEGRHELKFTELSLNKETALLAAGSDAVLLFTSDDASAEVLEELSHAGVKFIALRSAGYDHVDINKARQLGIKVANVPAYSPYAIAEHAVTLLLALNRKVVLAQQLLRENDFRLGKLIGFDLHGKTIGVVGTGHIGSAFCKIMNGFGCKLLGFDILKDENLISETGITYVSFDELCSTSDIISVHCPLNQATKYLFDNTAFSKMKRGVVFINTARGGIVNTMDLMNALESNVISAAGLDVYENEKPIFFHDHSQKGINDPLFDQLRKHPNVLVTAHQAFLTNEALSGIANSTISSLDAWSKNLNCENELTTI